MAGTMPRSQGWKLSHDLLLAQLCPAAGFRTRRCGLGQFLRFLPDSAPPAPPPTGDFADLMSEQDAAARLPATATAMPDFTILAPTLIPLLAAP